MTRDELDYLDAAADFVRSYAEAELAKERVVRLARRITEDWRLSDEEAVVAAWERAAASVRAVRAAG